MSKLLVRGGNRLRGEISVGGSKNAALPIIFASIATRGVTIIHNMPSIVDVSVALDIISGLGARVEAFSGSVRIDTGDMSYSPPDKTKISRLRASSYLIGASLARFNICPPLSVGGCAFDDRPIDMHIMAAEALGANLSQNHLVADGLFGADIRFRKISVGATVNALIMASCAKGESKIFGYAKEPHVMTLIEYLTLAGAKIDFTDESISVIGAELSGAEITLPPDMIEAGSYAAMSLIFGGDIKVSPYPASHLTSFSDVIIEGGAKVKLDGAAAAFSGKIDKPLTVIAEPYPKYPTDLQPIIAPLLLSSAGGEIYDTVFENRFGYLKTLGSFGAEFEPWGKGYRLYPSQFHSASVMATDLRGGMAALILALYAEGESEIDGFDLILRGYENIFLKLLSIGADIKVI